VDGDDDGQEISPYIYQLLFYKKKGGAAIKAIDSNAISLLYVQQSNRPLAWLPSERRLLLESEVDSRNASIATQVCLGGENKGEFTSATGSSSYVFVVVENDHEYVLRASKIDKMVRGRDSLAILLLALSI
jgi:hypothetical protein